MAESAELNRCSTEFYKHYQDEDFGSQRDSDADTEALLVGGGRISLPLHVDHACCFEKSEFKSYIELKTVSCEAWHSSSNISLLDLTMCPANGFLQRSWQQQRLMPQLW